MKIEIKDLHPLFEKISALLKTDITTENFASQLLQELGSRLNCQWGTYWHVTEDHHLQPLVLWTQHGFTAPKLEKDTKHRVLTISEGTAGHVWRSGKPIWTLDLIKDMCLPRSIDANSSGLTGGIWFAIKTDTSIYAVVELLGHYLVPPSTELITAIEEFGLLLGKLLKNR